MPKPIKNGLILVHGRWYMIVRLFNCWSKLIKAFAFRHLSNVNIIIMHVQHFLIHLRWIVVYTIRYVSCCAYRRDYQAQAHAQSEAQVSGTIDLTLVEYLAGGSICRC